ncbi:Hydrogenase maturation factor [Desulfonema limicola]|uniref:Hydrogenase maturation factor HypA n=1 Tax=Desulfonema limicola TaxID=45656 RepID=A0A975GFF7_9BACT|nr:hydrogenase maturation nickel metallochaperone HypA [Desulfonema limicola]QTA79124.1 Hydrogenase maturation factor [Desulfonema limicola]
MHEMGIAMQLVEIASAAIPGDMENIQVEKVNLKLGKLSSVVPDSLRFCFEIITKETLLAGAELCIQEIEVTARCNDCNAEWTITGPAFSCEKCKSGNITIVSGQELEISSIEIADE